MKTAMHFILSLAGMTAFIFLIGFAGKVENDYTRNATVVELSDGTPIFQDEGGNYWKSDKVYDFAVGDVVELEMFNNYTWDIIGDDEILQVNLQ